MSCLSIALCIFISLRARCCWCYDKEEYKRSTEDQQQTLPSNQLTQDDISTFVGGITFDLNEIDAVKAEYIKFSIDFNSTHGILPNLQSKTDQEKTHELEKLYRLRYDPSFGQQKYQAFSELTNYTSLSNYTGKKYCLTLNGILEHRNGNFFLVEPQIDDATGMVIDIVDCQGKDENAVESSRKFITDDLNLKSLQKILPAKHNGNTVNYEDIDDSDPRKYYKPNLTEFVSALKTCWFGFKSIAIKMKLKQNQIFVLAQLIGYDSGFNSLKDSEVFQYVKPNDAGTDFIPITKQEAIQYYTQNPL